MTKLISVIVAVTLFLAPSFAGAVELSSEAQSWLRERPQYLRKLQSLCTWKKAKTTTRPLRSALERPSRLSRDANLPDKHVILTFDDGPRIPHTEIVLLALSQCGVRAHFFVVGRQLNSARKRDILKGMSQTGHLVGSHSYSHRNLMRSYAPAARWQIRHAHELVTQATGVDSPFFRFPYGAGDRSERLLRFLEDEQLVSFYWTFAAPDISERISKRLLQRTLQRVDRYRRGVVLAHDRKLVTVMMLPDLLSALIDRGYTFVTLLPEPQMAKGD